MSMHACIATCAVLFSFRTSSPTVRSLVFFLHLKPALFSCPQPLISIFWNELRCEHLFFLLIDILRLLGTGDYYNVAHHFKNTSHLCFFYFQGWKEKKPNLYCRSLDVYTRQGFTSTQVASQKKSKGRTRSVNRLGMIFFYLVDRAFCFFVHVMSISFSLSYVWSWVMGRLLVVRSHCSMSDARISSLPWLPVSLASPRFFSCCFGAQLLISQLLLSFFAIIPLPSFSSARPPVRFVYLCACFFVLVRPLSFSLPLFLLGFNSFFLFYFLFLSIVQIKTPPGNKEKDTRYMDDARKNK